MLFYFNDRPPSFLGFKTWVDCEFNLKRDWAFEQVRYLGRNFFLVKFCRGSHRDRAVEDGPWYMGRRPIHSYAWHTGFNLDTELFEELPVWIELTLRNQILEPSCRALTSDLGPIIHYQAGDEHSEYPNDRACILWSTGRTVPRKLKLVYRSTTLWQDISFKTIPNSCTICRSTVHLAYACPTRQNSTTVNTRLTPIPSPAPRTPTHSLNTETSRTSKSNSRPATNHNPEPRIVPPAVNLSPAPSQNNNHQSNSLNPENFSQQD
jgi:hypothetical protein